MRFLQATADFFIKNYSENIQDILLVFPNRRSCVVFTEEYKKALGSKQAWIPSQNTINEFVQKLSGLRIADSLQLLTTLYVDYKEISKSKETFDEFFSWGELLLTDFNDIDKYLVDPESVFINVKNWKEIEPDESLLSDEQVESLKRFFSVFEKKESALKKEFLKIWEILLPLYNTFRKHVTNEMYGYEGLVYKDALKNISNSDDIKLRYSKIFFIGFNAITPVEEEIFSVLHKNNSAGFMWDFDNYYINNTRMEAGMFQRKLLKKFPPEKLNKGFDNLKGKNINIIAASTNSGQVFATANILNNTESQNYTDTAIILSDESLLLPVINNIPQKVSEVNITMGYPLNNSLTGNFADLLIRLNANIRIKEDVNTFYYKDVQAILRHPFLNFICKDDSVDIDNRITKNNQFYIPVVDLVNNDLLKLIFHNSTINTPHLFNEYIISTMEYIQEKLWDDTINSSIVLEREFIFRMLDAITKFDVRLAKTGIEMSMSTYFKLLSRTIKSISVPFEGEPVSGLQIMGFLETRNLDFKNIILLSVNEGVVPAGSSMASFIPYGLRKGFGLPGIELNDAMYSYYFYRLLQYAENITIIYNSASGGLQSGEKSRLLYQLEYDKNFNVTNHTITHSIDITSEREILIKKEGAVWKKLQTYLTPGSRRYLSPSALSSYLQCSLRFYFKSIAEIREIDDVDETVDARIFGNLFHKTAEIIYGNFSEKELITEEVLEKAKNNNSIDKAIKLSFKEVFYGEASDKEFEIDGKNSIVAKVIKRYIIQLLEKDKSFVPFTIMGLESVFEKNVKIDTPESIYTVKIKGTVDRIDRTDRLLRVIDYKTGSDKLLFAEIDDIFNPQKIHDTKAVFQTFIYSWLISEDACFTHELAISPMIYQVKKLFDKDETFMVKMGTGKNTAQINFKDFMEETSLRIKELLSEIFNREIPFSQTARTKNCEYCNYKGICGR